MIQNQAKKIDEAFSRINEMPKSDYQLFGAEIEVNNAHCESLFHAGILTRLESERIKNGLQTIAKRAEYDKNYFTELGLMDVHSFVPARLEQLIGDTGKKIRIGRSETEHKLTTLRLWLRREIEEITIFVKNFQSELIYAAENQKNIIFPVKGNFEKTQIVFWAHWCLAYFEILERDKERLDEVWRRVNISPFGAETSFEIDREEIAASLKFEGVSMNSLDAVFDSDFILEFCGACSLLMIHLARFAGEIIIYIFKEFRLLELKNENLFIRENLYSDLEFLTEKASRIFGHQTALLTMNLSSSLCSKKNLREEKEALFEIVKTAKLSLKAVSMVIKNIKVNEQKAFTKASENFSTGSELTDYLLKKDVPFEAVNETVNKISDYAAGKNKQPGELALSELQTFSTVINEDVFQILEIKYSLNSRNQIGGTASERVSEALEAAKKTLETEDF